MGGGGGGGGSLTGKLEVVALTLSLALSVFSTSCAISLAGGEEDSLHKPFMVLLQYVRYLSCMSWVQKLWNLVSVSEYNVKWSHGGVIDIILFIM